ncbi:MAG: DUF302 domain-containing protein [Bacteroidales bacterium]|nr:DUF302 domain-containing protein [Bacteroidales bacterium]
MTYYFTTTIENTDFETAVQKTTEGLKEEGFGVISTIDFQATLKEKLDVDFRKYSVLQACNPPYAYKSLQTEDKIGTLLPCNVVVQEVKEGTFEVSSINPQAAMASVENDTMAQIAKEISEKLKRVIDNLK